MQRKRRGDVTRHAAHTTRRVRVRVSTARSAHRRRDRRRSVGTTTRSRLGARSAGLPVSAQTEPSRRCNARGAVMSLDTRRTRHGEYVCACRSRDDRRSDEEAGGARSARRLARDSTIARRALPASAQTEPSRRCNARGAVMSLDTRRTRHGEYVCACRRRDRCTHDEVGGARSARRLARGSALARRACRCRLRQSRAGDATQEAR